MFEQVVMQREISFLSLLGLRGLISYLLYIINQDENQKVPSPSLTLEVSFLKTLSLSVSFTSSQPSLLPHFPISVPSPVRDQMLILNIK